MMTIQLIGLLLMLGAGAGFIALAQSDRELDAREESWKSVMRLGDRP